ncbi:alpha-xylosidase [Streptococcus sp. S784/96/1]|uniref:alpha-xylosidase n=1 Tax=Streptococcus sp. S784/96/1 TaxID=2653499 RepID=UPI0013873EAE|nr:alpha-xylosidase [Streptococcus sp. S784/96/1]
MKFTNGYWLTRKEYTLNYPRQCVGYRQRQEEIAFYVPYKNIVSRGDTLNVGMTTITVSSCIEGVFRIKLTHFDTGQEHVQFQLNDCSGNFLEFLETEEYYICQTGNLGLHIAKKSPFQMAFYRSGELITMSKPKAQAEISDQNGKHYMREQLLLSPDEYLYGLGERFTPFVKNGQSVDIWNEDGGTGSEQSYKNIPFYISNKNYGVFVNHTGKVSFELASENVSCAQFSTEGECLEYFFIDGESMNEVLSKYTRLTGKPSLPPQWSFGLWLSTSFVTDYSEETVLEFIDGMLDRGIPFNVFHFDCFWMKEYEWCGFEWDKDAFPDPKGLIQKIHDRGIKVCLWINPYIGQKAKVFEFCRDNGYFLKREDGCTWQWDLWQAGQGIIDFTNPEAKSWFQEKLKSLLSLGVDAFKTDFGERIPTDCQYYDGSDPEEMHNYYDYLYNQSVFEVLKEVKGDKEAVLFARSASVGSQKFPVHWGGDNLSEYYSMAESLRGGLSFLMSGFGFWSHDIGGFEESATEDLYKRWTQFGLLSTHSRYHGNIEYRVPWKFGEEAVCVTREFSKLKNRLMPYLYSQAVKTSQTGIPMMKPLVLEFPDDPNVLVIDKQYMLGDSLMIAPIFREDGKVKFYVPQSKGLWTDLLTLETYEGGRWYEREYDYLHLPILVKPNTILCIGKEELTADYDITNGIRVNLFQINEDSEVEIFNSDGQLAGKVIVKYSNSELDMSSEGIDVTDFSILS